MTTPDPALVERFKKLIPEMTCLSVHGYGPCREDHNASLRYQIATLCAEYAREQREADQAVIVQYQRESADENTCVRHPKTILVYHCAACADAARELGVRLRETLDAIATDDNLLAEYLARRKAR